MKVMARAYSNHRINNATSQSDPTALAIAQDELANHNVLVSAAIDACHHRATGLIHPNASKTSPGPGPTTAPPAPSAPSFSPAQKGPVPTTTDSLFVGVKLASAYTYLKEYPGSQWPTTNDPGIVVLALTCAGPESFRNLLAPDAYYVVNYRRIPGELYAPGPRLRKPRVQGHLSTWRHL